MEGTAPSPVRHLALASPRERTMNKYMIKLDPQRCISCKSCEASCKAYKHTPAGAKLGLLVTVGPQTMDGKVSVNSGFRPCFHCQEPWCVAACPTGAMMKREEDGLVLVQAELCVGCKACIDACPWMVPQWDDTTRKVLKCDYCRERVEAGQDPACVSVCTGHAMSFHRANLESRKARTDYAQAVLGNPAKAKKRD